MKIYKLYIDKSKYAVLSPVQDKFDYALWTNKDFKKINETFEVEKVDSETKNLQLQIGDFAGMGREFPFIISNKALTLLESFVNKNEELRQVLIVNNKESAFVYWPSKVIDCLDTTKSDINVLPGGYRHLVKPVFNHSVLTEGLIFIVPQFMTNSLFVTEDVAEIILNSDLTGYILVDASIPREL